MLMISTFFIYIITCPAFAQPEHNRASISKIIVLDVYEASSGWIDKDSFTRFFVDEIRKINSSIEIHVQILHRIEDWEKLLKDAPQAIIIVNSHGEIIPIPSSYNADWCTFLGDLARLIKDKGWVLVNPVGYAFWGVGNSADPRVGSAKIIEEHGLNCFMWGVGLAASAWPLLPEDEMNGQFNELSKRLFDIFGYEIGYEMPECIPVHRPLTVFNGTTEVLPLWALIEVKRENVTCYGFAAYKIGRGYLIWGGLHHTAPGTKVPDDITARLTAAAVAYFIDPDVILMPATPKKSFLLKPSTIILALFLVVLAIISLYILKALGFIGKRFK
jgi:hypothetical protein